MDGGDAVVGHGEVERSDAHGDGDAAVVGIDVGEPVDLLHVGGLMAAGGEKEEEGKENTSPDPSKEGESMTDRRRNRVMGSCICEHKGKGD